MSSLKPAPHTLKYIVVFLICCCFLFLSVRVIPQSSSHHQGESSLSDLSLFRGATTRNRVHFASHAHLEAGLILNISLQFANDFLIVGCWTSSKSLSRGEKGPACSAVLRWGLRNAQGTGGRRVNWNMGLGD